MGSNPDSASFNNITGASSLTLKIEKAVIPTSLSCDYEAQGPGTYTGLIPNKWSIKMIIHWNTCTAGLSVH